MIEMNQQTHEMMGVVGCEEGEHLGFGALVGVVPGHVISIRPDGEGGVI